MAYALLLFPTSADLPVTVIQGYFTESDADDAGTAALVDPYFDHALVIPAPVASNALTINQGGGSPGGGGGGGQQQ